MAYRCGDTGHVDIGFPAVFQLEVTSWEGAENANLSETTNTGSGGYKENISCLKWFTATVEGDFDPTKGPKSAAATILAAGDLMTDMVLHTDGQGFYTMDAHVTRLNWRNPAGEKVSYSIDIESDGAYLYTP